MTRSFNPWAIRNVGDGNTGWIQGRVVGEPPLVAPVSKRPCFHYSVLVPDQGAAEETVAELVIDDGTGRAVITLAGAVIQVDYDHTRGSTREGVLAAGELIAVHGTCRWERDPSSTRANLYRDPLPQRLRVTATSRVRLWVTEDVAERD